MVAAMEKVCRWAAAEYTLVGAGVTQKHCCIEQSYFIGSC